MKYLVVVLVMLSSFNLFGQAKVTSKQNNTINEIKEKENNSSFHPRIGFGIGLNIMAEQGIKKENILTGVAYTISFQFPLGNSDLYSILLKYNYFELNTTFIESNKTTTWGSNISLMYSVYKSDKFISNIYGGIYAVTSPVPISPLVNFNLGVIFTFRFTKEIELASDIYKLINPFGYEHTSEGIYFPYVITLNFSIRI